MAAVWDVDHCTVYGRCIPFVPGVVMLKYLAGSQSEKFILSIVAQLKIIID